MNQGDDWSSISEDLTSGGKKGDVAYGTLTTLSESPFQFGLLYVGSDDGLVHISKDGGGEWQKISDPLPKDMWISRVEASVHEKARVYASLNGYRWDDFSAYIYISDDYGTTWHRLGLDLPAEPINVIKEDPVNANLLYVGTDHGIYISLDRGKSFMVMDNNLPRVGVHDLIIHPDAHELIVGTHGRSIYLADVSQLQKMSAENLKEPMIAFSVDKFPFSRRWGRGSGYSEDYNEPEVLIPVYLHKEGGLTVHVQNEKGLRFKSFEINGNKGIQFIPYHLDIDSDKEADYLEYQQEGEEDYEFPETDNSKHYLDKGTYEMVITFGEITKKQTLTIE